MNRTAGDPCGRPWGFPAQSPTTVQYNLGGSARQVPGLAIQRRAVRPLGPIVGGTRRAASFRHPPPRHSAWRNAMSSCSILLPPRMGRIDGERPTSHASFTWLRLMPNAADTSWRAARRRVEPG